MIPQQAVINAMRDLIANDTATLAQAAPQFGVILIKAPFTPDPSLTMADFSAIVADFVTSTPLHASAGVWATLVDPTDGSMLVQGASPAGGWTWQVTTTLHLPQTIYGYIVVDKTLAILLGMEKFNTPVILTGVGQFIDVPAVQMRWSPASFS